MLGTFILWFGWYGFNSGNALTFLPPPQAYEVVGLAVTNTTLAAGMGALTSLLVQQWYLYQKTGKTFFNVQAAMNGALAGLVAITAGCAVVEPWAALVTGFIAGPLYLLGSNLLISFCIDDAVDAIPVHLVAGMWGLIAVGLFASPDRLDVVFGRSDHPGLVYSVRNNNFDIRLLGVQFVGIGFILGWVTLFMLPFFIWLDWQGWFRSDPLEEIFGLDVSYHDGVTMMGNEGEGGVIIDRSTIEPNEGDDYSERETLKAVTPKTTTTQSIVKTSEDKDE